MSVTRTFTLLGTGSSGGVPRVGGDWGDCDPAEPRNRRRRCAMLVAQRGAGGETTLQIDAGADLREQLLGAGVTSLDATLLTHPHADHIFGLDDLRQLALKLRRPIEVCMDEGTSRTVMRSFGYCFRQAPGSRYPPFCTERRIVHPEPFAVDGLGGAIEVETILARHGDIDALGFRIGDVAYLPDVKRVDDETSLDRLAGLDVLIVDALRHRPHPAHLSLEESLALIAHLAPRRAILTNLHGDLDYATLAASLPPGVEPGHDGLRVEVAVPADPRAA